MMTILKVMIAIMLAFGLFVTSPAMSQDFQRGVKNYQEIMGGKKKFEQLSPQEQQEVIIIYQRMKARNVGSNKSSECRNAMSDAERAASELADYARRLRNCAEENDFSNDCSTEFRRVRNAYSDYESAVSSVGSYCR